MKVFKLAFLFVFSFFLFGIQSASCQILVTNNAPYNTAEYLIDSLLLGEGVIATNHAFQGDSLQIGFFNGVNSNIGLDSGIVISTGDINEVVPGTFGSLITNDSTNQDLLDLANSVPALIGQDFTVASANDVAILEFDFVPVSSYMSFRYVFASDEYFGFENTQFNDVFGFFISGPNIVGPYSSPVDFPNGSINIATFTSVEGNSLDANLPITISSINNDYNSSFFVSNQDNGTNTVNPFGADGFTIVMTAQAQVVCGQTYHIRLAIADGADTGLSSFVFLDAGSFSSPPITVGNSLGINSSQIFTDCGAPVTLSANVDNPDVFDFLWNTGDTTQSITVPPGYYWVRATDTSGCSIESDSLVVYSQPLPEIELIDSSHYCENSSLLISPTVSDGTPPYNYEWLGYGDDLELEVNQEETYTLVVFDSNGCSDTASIVIDEKLLPELSFSPQDILVCAGTSVSIDVEGAKSYKWSPNISLSSDTGSTVEISALSSITYTVEGTDVYDCVNSIHVPITANESFDLDIATSPVSCQGYTNGSITIIPQNTAVWPLQYSIDGGQSFHNNFTFTNLEYGVYNVVVMDGLGCIVSDTAIVGSSEPEIEVIVSSLNPKCYNDTTGLVWVSAITGGNVDSSYSYKWYNSSTHQLIGTDSVLSVPAAGYYLVVEDDNGCRTTDEADVEQPLALLYDVVKTDISCYGEKDGEITINIYGGGTPPFNLDWINYGNASTSFLSNLEKGSYDLSVTDSNNCVTSLNFEIDEPISPLVLELDSTKINCYGELSGTASVSVSGGTPPYFYQWSSGHVTPLAEQIPSGIHTVVVTDSRGCSALDSVEVVENNQIVSNVSSTPTSCFGTQDGTASINASGGVGSLLYSWSNGTSSTSITSGYGEYYIMIEDELGCKRVDTILINQPRKMNVRLTTEDVSCNGGYDGKLVSSVSGGTPGYTYNWTIDGNPLPYTNPIADILPASTSPYALEVIDDNGCSKTVYAFISNPPKLVLDTSEIIASYCYNIAVGEASVVASGGFLNAESDYSFSWSTGDTGSVLSNQAAGVYTVVVEDDNLCKDSLELEIPFEDNFTLEITSDSTNCNGDNGGAATVISTGGFGPYVYNWNTVNMGIINQNSNSNINTVLNLSSGITSVVVTDVNGCAKTTQVNVGQAEQLIVSIFKESDESCSGEVSSCDGQLRVEAEGGIGSYTFNCLDGSNNLIASGVSADEFLFSSLCADFYQIVVEDEKGCLGVLSGSGLSHPVEIIAGTPVESFINTSSGSITNGILCYGDTAVSLSVLNPSPSYNYDWYVNDQFLASGLSVVLPAGNVRVRAISSPTCYTNSEEVTIYQPSQLSISQEIEEVSCNGGSNGSINVEPSGGFPSYSYTWSNEDSFITISEDLSDLSAGVYSLTLKDANNCERQFELEVREPSALVIDATVQDVSCNGGNDGVATLSINGGVEPYLVDWQGVNPLSLTQGNHEVVVTDSNLCSETIEVEINQSSGIVPSFNINQTPFIATATGGVPPYTFDWLYYGNYQSSGVSYSPELDGEYTLVVKDSKDCENRVMKIYERVDVSEFVKSKVLIYPNPVFDNFTVKVQSDEISSDEYTFNLLDSRGRVLREIVFDGIVQVNRENLAKGVYIIQISSERVSHQQKIIFE